MSDSTDRQEKLQAYIDQIDDLPTLPYAVIQLTNRIHEPNPQIDELADLIMTDQILTTKLMRIVNSAYWGLNRKIESVRETIIYLGLREIENLIYSVTLTNTFEIDAPLMKRVKFWEHSFGCALYSRLIAEMIGFEGKEMAYLGGLLHDVGESIIALKLYYKFEEVVKLVQEKNFTFYKAEDEILGINHTDFGPWLQENWLLPEMITHIICYHHSLERTEKDKDIILDIVRLADLICLYHKLDFGFKEGEDLKEGILSVWKRLCTDYPKLREVKIKDFLDQCNNQIENIKRTVQMVYSME